MKSEFLSTFLSILVTTLMAMVFVLITYKIYGIYLTSNSFLNQLAILILFSFTIVVTLRYIILIFLSMAKNIQRTIDAKKRASVELKLSIIVPAFNEELVIEKSILSIMEQSYPHIEIIVVDDGSTDNTFVRAKFLEFNNGQQSLRVLRKENGGKARAINYGIEHSTSELIMVVDADTRLSIDAVEKMVDYFSDEKIGAIAGSVYVSNRKNILTRLQALEYIEGLNMVRNGQSFFKLVSIIPGPIGIFRKSALDAVGGYDHDTFAEDADLTLKLISHGYKIDFEPEAFAYTEAPDSLLDLLKQRYRWTRGILQSINKHKHQLFNVVQKPSISLVLWYMLFESILWPFVDLFATLFFLYTSYTSGVSAFIFYWWMLFTILDLAGAFYCILVTRENLSLIFYTIFYRLYFIMVINIAKVFATFEELFNFKMDWGKLERKGEI